MNGEADNGDVEGEENGEQLGSLRKIDLAAVGWDKNDAMVFGSPITIEMANVINYNATVVAQKQAEREIEVGTNTKREVDKAAKSFEQVNRVVLEEGAVRTKGHLLKYCKPTSAEKENESPDGSSRHVIYIYSNAKHPI